MGVRYTYCLWTEKYLETTFFLSASTKFTNKTFCKWYLFSFFFFFSVHPYHYIEHFSWNHSRFAVRAPMTDLVNAIQAVKKIFFIFSKHQIENFGVGRENFAVGHRKNGKWASKAHPNIPRQTKYTQCSWKKIKVLNQQEGEKKATTIDCIGSNMIVLLICDCFEN